MLNRYEKRVMELEEEGMTTSDAQGVADLEFARENALGLLAALRVFVGVKRMSTGMSRYNEADLDYARECAIDAIAKAEGRV